MNHRKALTLAAAVIVASVPAAAMAHQLDGLDGPNNGQSSEHRQDDFVSICHHTDEHAAHEWITVQVDDDAWAAHTSAHSGHELDFLVTAETPCPPVVVVPTPDPTETPTVTPTPTPTVTPTDNPTVTVPTVDVPVIEVSDTALDAQAADFATINPVEQTAVEGQLPTTGVPAPLLGGLGTSLAGVGLYLRRRFRV